MVESHFNKVTDLKAENPIKDLTRLEFPKKISMLDPVKRLCKIKWYNPNSTRHVKTPSNSTDTTVKRYAIQQRDFIPY